MNKGVPGWINTTAGAVYACSGTVLTLLQHENVISGQLAVDIASIITTFAAAFHTGQYIATGSATSSTAITSTSPTVPKHEAQ